MRSRTHLSNFSGSLDYDELVRMAPSNTSSIDEVRVDRSSPEALLLDLVQTLGKAHVTARVRDIFRSWDADGSGTVSRREFGRMLPAIGMTGVETEDVDRLFSSLDTDGSGSLDVLELDGKLRRAYYKLTHKGSLTKG